MTPITPPARSGAGPPRVSSTPFRRPEANDFASPATTSPVQADEMEGGGGRFNFSSPSVIAKAFSQQFGMVPTRSDRAPQRPRQRLRRLGEGSGGGYLAHCTVTRARQRLLKGPARCKAARRPGRRIVGDWEDDSSHSSDDLTWNCFQCGSRKSTKDNQIALCDHCDHAFHARCLDPPLSEFPAGDWFCNRAECIADRCKPDGKDCQSNREVSEEEDVWEPPCSSRGQIEMGKVAQANKENLDGNT